VKAGIGHGRSAKFRGVESASTRPKTKSKASPWTLTTLLNLIAATIAVGNLAHFLMKGERHKGQRHHKRHGKNDRIHIGIISHFGQLQQFCYSIVTCQCLSSAGGAGDVPSAR
jgi:hypothetical protein